VNCKSYQKMISRWLDGEISEEDMKSLNRHLEVCPECRRVKSDFSFLHEVHLGQKDEPVPESTLRVLETGLPEEKRSGGFRVLRNAALAAGLAGVIIAGGSIGGFLAEKGLLNHDRDAADILNVEYLYANPPGSTGEILIGTVESGFEDE